jgi:pyridinium-3,5-bisthiocarboxylic acid mononucleotide nickel chelatase
MVTLAFDGRMGASGDMLLAALLDIGADSAVLKPVESALPVRYEVGTTDRNGIAATTVDVLVTDRPDGRDTVDFDDGEHTHTHDHSHDTHNHGPEYPQDIGHSDTEGLGHFRSYSEVSELISRMDLDGAVERNARAIIEILGRAEAAVHGTDLDSVHFHEVGADDAIADIVGCALLFADLDPDRVLTTALATGGGEVTMSHGTYPVPAPAVVEIAAGADWSLRGGPIDVELLTPTGAAILTHYADGIDSLPAMNLDTSGYGAGSRALPDRPNVLGVLRGETDGALSDDPIRVLETTLDDATPEILGSLHDSLRAVGARDVVVTPATVKKSRPGHAVQVLVKAEDRARVARRLAEETGTLGIRETPTRHRWIANREIDSVDIEVDGRSFPVEVKIARDEASEIYDISAEYDAAVAAAGEVDLPVREVMRRAERIARDRLDTA